MLRRLLMCGLLLTTVPALAQGTPEQLDRNVSAYNLQQGVGLKGFDPVSYFAEGGSAPMMGQERYSAEYGGVTYLFANSRHRALFLEDPTKYEPTYGGWCAWAMAHGSLVDIQPQFYILNGNRLHFFVSRRARDNFAKDIPKYEMLADDHWLEVSGETPRI